MSVREDLLECSRVWRKWSWMGPDPRMILSCSGNAEQQELLTGIFPRAILRNCAIESWNLNDVCPLMPDIIVACNVFHYSPQPWIWFHNVLASCRYFWMQDLVLRQRGRDGGEFGDDGDCMRYVLGGGTLSRAGSVFDLLEQKTRLLDYHCYDAGSFREGKTLINFVACLKGDLT